MDRHSPVGLAPELEACVPQGVAFHHAGLTMEERTLIEGAFKSGVISVLVATTTLAAGVNLPARRVIVRDRKTFKGEELSVAQFQQMCGRAGRYGIDGQGEAILMTRRKEAEAARGFALRRLPPMQSALDRGQGGGVERAVLEVVAGGLAGGEGWLELFARSTLYAAQQAGGGGAGEARVLARFRAALAFLLQHRFVQGLAVAGPLPAPPTPPHTHPPSPAEHGHLARLTDLRSTHLGAATFFAAMAPHDAVDILSALSGAASRGVILTSDLHVLFLCVPPNRKFFHPVWADIYRR
jgi:DNA polymerase theta